MERARLVLKRGVFTYLWLPWLIQALARASLRLCFGGGNEPACLLSIEAYFWRFGHHLCWLAANFACRKPRKRLGVVAWNAYRQGIVHGSGAALLPVFVFCLCALALPLPATAIMPLLCVLVLSGCAQSSQPSWVFHNGFSHWLGRISFAFVFGALDCVRQPAAAVFPADRQGPGANLSLGQELAALPVLLSLCCLLAWGLQRWVEVPARTWGDGAGHAARVNNE